MRLVFKEVNSKVSGLFTSWLRKVGGATAVEFALVAFPFVMMITCILEIAMMFVAAVMVEGGTGVASRLIRTCQLQEMTGDPEENFVEAFCDHASFLSGCSEELMIESIVVPDGSFSSASGYDAQYDENGDFLPTGFDAGGDSDVILVRAFYNYQLVTPMFSQLLGGEDGEVPFMSTVVFEVEPCDFEY